MATTILLKANDMVKSTIIAGNIDTDKMIPSCKAYQEVYLKPLISKELYNKICQDFADDTLSGVYLELYEDYLKSMVIYGSTSLFLESAAYTVANSGVTKLSTETSESVVKEEVDYLVQSAQKLHNSYEREFLKWIKTQSIPEYTQPNIEGKRINVGGWSLFKKGRGY